MTFRFAVISDPHIALPLTIKHHSHRFHLVEVSIPAFEQAIDHLKQLELDFLLLPGDLTQDGERENHQWLIKKLKTLPFPTYVIPGNHDVLTPISTTESLGLIDFPTYYQPFGYDQPNRPYYTQKILENVQLIGLNSNQFNSEGKQLGYVDETQLRWLDDSLSQFSDQLILVMIHHNVIEHLPNQATHELGKRYMVDNAPQLLAILKKHGVKLILTGHLHVQDIINDNDIYEITTGSLVSYPHPYRVIEVETHHSAKIKCNIQSYNIKNVPDFANLSEISRDWLGDRSFPFMMRLLTSSPLNLSEEVALQFAPKLRNFWADIAEGDNSFDFPDFPDSVRQYFQAFGVNHTDGMPHHGDNQATLMIDSVLGKGLE